MAVEQSIVINASIDKVWNIIKDVNNWKSWNPVIKNSKYTVGDDLLINNKLEIKIKSGIKTFKYNPMIIESNSPYIVAWTGDCSGFHRRLTFILDNSKQTTVTMIEEILGMGTFIARILLPESAIKKTNKIFLESLKKEAEK